MSVDKKIMMPFFTMKMGGIWMADKRYMFDFLLVSGSEDVHVIHEDHYLRDSFDASTWQYINSYVPYVEKP